jgi:hypothetical protein
MAGFVMVAVLMVATQVLSVSAAAPAEVNGISGTGCDDVKLVGATWYYNWYVETDCDAPGFVPMVSGRNKQDPGDIQWSVDRAYAAGYRTLLGFNEPNQEGQSLMSVEKALDLWPIMTSHGDVRVGSPAVSGSAEGDRWIADFMKGVEARGLRVDFVAAHFYGWDPGSCTVANAERYLNKIKSLAGGRPIWVTEFGCLNQSNTGESVVRDFFTQAVKMFKDVGIERWAWYAAERNHAVSVNGRLTSLGKLFP